MSTTAPSTRPAVSSTRRGGRSYGSHPGRALLNQARQGLLDAACTTRPVDRYVRAYLAALRAAAAVLVVRARPTRRTRQTSTWVLLARITPEFAEWSNFFAAASARRAGAEAGIHRLVTDRDADDLVRQVEQFLILVERTVDGTSR